jgi:predicted HicB family RNase H-like nuclease
LCCRWQYTSGMAKKPPAERTYEVPLQVRITPEQMERYRQAAEADGRSLSNWARDRLDKAAAKELKG